MHMKVTLRDKMSSEATRKQSMCSHHWILPTTSVGENYVGICKYCGITQNFLVDPPTRFIYWRRGFLLEPEEVSPNVE